MLDTSSLALLGPAFLAGFITFFAPCTLPLVPAYLAMLAGVSEEDFLHPERSQWARRRMVVNGLAFILGFTLVFVSFGVAAGFLSKEVTVLRDVLERIGGVLVILFGLFLLGAVRIRLLEREFHFQAPKALHPGSPIAALVVGMAFALGWSPCIGPILGSILLVAASAGSALSGALLLIVFSLGLAVPFLVITFAFTTASKLVARINPYLKVASVVGGIFLIMLGVALVSGKAGFLIGYLYDFLTHLDYEESLSPFL